MKSKLFWVMFGVSVGIAAVVAYQKMCAERADEENVNALEENVSLRLAELEDHASKLAS